MAEYNFPENTKFAKAFGHEASVAPAKDWGEFFKRDWRETCEWMGDKEGVKKLVLVALTTLAMAGGLVATARKVGIDSSLDSQETTFKKMIETRGDGISRDVLQAAFSKDLADRGLPTSETHRVGTGVTIVGKTIFPHAINVTQPISVSGVAAPEKPIADFDRIVDLAKAIQKAADQVPAKGAVR